MLVKVCGITCLEDALAAVSEGANALGFNFYSKSPRYLMPDAAAEIGSRLPAGVLKVGVFVNERPSEVRRISEVAGLDVAQLHGDEPPVEIAGLRLWKAFHVSAAWDASMMRGFSVEAAVLDTAAKGLYGGTGEVFDWTLIRGVQMRIVLAGGLDASNVAEAIRTVRPWGVDACSRLESAPGRKDLEKMSRFIRAALSESS
jgi:phosphoribosylanthranilate isomerase